MVLTPCALVTVPTFLTRPIARQLTASTKPHGSTSHKTVTFRRTAVSTSTQ